jgi:hypothetical protein
VYIECGKNTKICTTLLRYISLFYFLFVFRYFGLYSTTRSCSVERQGCFSVGFYIAGVEVGLEVNTGTTKDMLPFRHQNSGQIYDLKTANRFFGNIKEETELGQCLLPFIP